MSCDPPPQKKVRATLGLEAPGPSNYEDIWNNSELSEDMMKTSGALFGSKRAWYVRQSYIDLYEEVVNDQERLTQIVNGTAGIGKSAFLLYILARLRCAGKSALLHHHRYGASEATSMYFPAGGEAIAMLSAAPNYFETFREWYRLTGQANTIFLVDGIVSFIKDDVPDVRYVTARSPSCDIAFMEKDPNRRDRWLDFWTEEELLDYAEKADIPDAKTIIPDNMRHIGGVARYAFGKADAKDAIQAALSSLDAKSLLRVVTTDLMGKFENQKVVDRLIHRHPPPDGIGVFGSKFTFASEFVATKVSMALALATVIKTAELLRSLEGVGPAGGMRGVLFEAYAARKIAEGGSFSVRQIGSAKEQGLALQASEILQKDMKTLNKTNYPLDEVKGKVVWPHPSQNMPAIDMFAYQETCMAFQATVSKSHSLDIKGAKAFLKYFDSLLRELKQNVPKQHPLYFVVPADIFEQFSKTVQPITGTHGVVLNTQESKATGARIIQWVMKVE